MLFKVTAAAATTVPDLGITLPVGETVLTDQFTAYELQTSLDLEALIQAGTLVLNLDYGSGYQPIVAATYTTKDAFSAYLNMYELSDNDANEKLVNNSDASAGTQLHHHDTRYYTKTELNQATGTTGSDLVGDDDDYSNMDPAAATQKAFNKAVDAEFDQVTLDYVYGKDSDGLMAVNGTNKPLDLESNNVNDIIISRKAGADKQDLLRADVSANELILGSAPVGALGQANVRIKRDLIVEGNFTFNGTITDTTVNNLEVTNANILLRKDASTDSDAMVEVSRPVAGTNATLRWDETLDRWKAGLKGTEQIVALADTDEVVTGVYEFQGGGATEPSMFVTNKPAAPSVNLGTASQVPMTMIAGVLAVYDKIGTRNKWLSVYRQQLYFSGRDHQNNSNEYARLNGTFTSNQSSARLMKNMTLVGISIQTNGNATWTARVRKNGAATNLASLTSTAAAGAQDNALNIDFNAGDKIEVFIDGSSVNRPVIVLEFAQRF